VPNFRTTTVARIIEQRKGLQRVELDGDLGRAQVLTDVIGTVEEGDEVVVNTTAVDLALGTGGWHFVHWNLSRREWLQPGPGHVMKMRYTGIQLDTGAVEEHDGYTEIESLDGTPVVVCELHSQLAAVVAGARSVKSEISIAYVMTDQAALPLALSDLVHELRGRSLLDCTVTAGQAFGGDFESVNVPSALQVAVSLGQVDMVVVGQGPGVVGTGTELGFSGIEVASIADVSHRLGAVSYVALRWSGADSRARHRGMSHHSKTVLKLSDERVRVAIPSSASEVDVGAHVVEVVDVPDPQSLFADLGIEVNSMGRSAKDDPGFFEYSIAAGIAAAQNI
jgi:hypothetical protein